MTALSDLAIKAEEELRAKDRELKSLLQRSEMVKHVQDGTV